MPLVSRYLAYFFSVIGHPMLMTMYVLFLYLKVNPYLFPYNTGRQIGTLVLIIFFTSVLIPAIAILLMLGVGFIESLELRDQKERIGPLIVTGIAYLWLYLNIRTHSSVPLPYSNFILGAIIALFIAFFINNFSKISLHGVGLGGLIMAVIHLFQEYGKGFLQLEMLGKVIQVNNLLVLASVLVLTGAVLSSRLFLRAHTNQEILGGLSVGVLGQLVAILFF